MLLIIGSANYARALCSARGVRFTDVLVGRHPGIRWLGLEPDRMQGAGRRGDELVVDRHSVELLDHDKRDAIDRAVRMLEIKIATLP